MQFDAQEDVAAPIETVFAKASDFEAFARAAKRHGADVERCDDMTFAGVGVHWRANASFRGSQHEATARVSVFDAPHGYDVIAHSAGIEGTLVLVCTALSPERTRLSLCVTLKPATLKARILMQSLKLAKGPLTNRFKQRVSDFARRIGTN
ncbi:MAG: hypothetical protein ACJA1F_002240 [Paracoccaceae bacterium]|jgi:hypothetical protein